MNKQQSDAIDIILPKLMAVKATIRPIKKDGNNTYHKSTYATINSCIDAYEPKLMEHGMMVIHQNRFNDVGVACLETRIYHVESGQWISSVAPLLNKGDCQGYGSADTYMRRYNMTALLDLYMSDDDGEAAQGRGDGNDLLTDKQKEEFTELMEKLDKDVRINIKRELKADGMETLDQVTKKAYAAKRPIMLESIKNSAKKAESEKKVAV